jgi:glycosyltransferase involved in cell wall biosynthesis
MRIALVVPGFSRNIDHCAIPALQSLASRMAQEHEVIVFSLRYPEAGVYQFGGFTHVALGGGTRRRLSSFLLWREGVRAVVAAHRQRPFDVLHSFWVDESGIVAVLAARQIKRPVIASVGGGELVYLPDIQYGGQGSLVRRQIIRLVLNWADLITAGSDYQLGICLAQTLSPSKYRLAPLGVDTDMLRPRVTPDWGRPTLVQAASLIGAKNQEMLLDVLREIQAGLPNVRLLLAGDGPLALPLQDLALRYGVADHVQWMGKLPYPQMAAFYPRGHLYLQTSRHESQGMSVIEALACGLPSLGTPVGVLPEVAAAPPQTAVAKIAEQIMNLFQAGYYEEQRRLARQSAVELFNLTHTTANFVQLYHEVLSSYESP